MNRNQILSIDDWLNKLKKRFKRYPRLYYFIIRYLSPVLSFAKPYDAIVDLVSKDVPIINLGSGAERISERITNLDITPYDNVDIVSDAHYLPFRDGSIGGIINIAMLEHVSNPRSVVNEIYRSLIPGGYVYIVLPFMFGFHASPNDYFRWTTEGIKEALKDFEEMEIGIASGPTTSLLLILQEWLSLLFSFRNLHVYTLLWIFFQILLTPFKFIDYYLIKHPMASKIAATFYFIGRKNVEK